VTASNLASVQLGDSADAEPAAAAEAAVGAVVAVVEAPGAGDDAEPAKPAAILRGSARGLEIFVDGRAATDAIAAAVNARLGEAPAFFRGSDVRVRVEDGPLPAGCLAMLDGIAQGLDMRIVEVGAAAKPAKAAKPTDSAPVPMPVLLTASGSRPVSETVPESVATTVSDSGSVSVSVSDLVSGSGSESVSESVSESGSGSGSGSVSSSVSVSVSGSVSESVSGSVSESVSVSDTVSESVSVSVSVSAPVSAATLAAEPAAEDLQSLSQTRTLVGPVRSGVILEHVGHIVILGDVNPGAEVRASGNIIVLGRLRGTAHAGIGRDNGFIMALRLEPQQLRIGRQVARAGDSDAAGAHPELAHITGGNIVVERYQGRLPSSLAASI
jgi:septum formation inhibitor MinC